MGGAIGVNRGSAGSESGIGLVAVEGTGFNASSDSTSAPARRIASLRTPRTSAYAFSDNGSINLRRRRISNSAAGVAPVTSSSRCSSARTSASLKSRVSIAFKTFSNTEVSATGVALVGPLTSETVACAAARLIASCRTPSTFTCTCSGSGSFSSSRRRTSNSSDGDAPDVSSRFSCAMTSVYVKPPVSNARKTFSNTTAGEAVLLRIRVVRRHPETVGPRMLGELGSDHESVTLTFADTGSLRSGSTPHLIHNHYIAKHAF